MKIQAKRFNGKTVYKGFYQGRIIASDSLLKVITFLLS